MNELLDLTAAAAGRSASTAMRAWAWVLGRAGAISTGETEVARRGFTVSRATVVQRLEAIGRQFVYGYNLAVGSCQLQQLAAQLAQLPADDAGFAYEGAGMGVALADWLTPGRRMFDAYTGGPACHHEYMAWVGLGWALARLPVRPERVLARYRSLHCWLALDGYGFHEGYFHWRQRIAGQSRPRGLSADGQHVFDQGLGRSLWFVRGADADAVAVALAAFDASRHADLWAGVGLAAAYAGGCEEAGLDALLAHSGRHRPALAQGVVFAAQARIRAGNCVPHVELACRRLLALDATRAGAIAVAAQPSGLTLADYQQWRFQIQRACGKEGSHVGT
ncbi:DUF1702 family protein [Rugamonas sp. A1-17]|nr:DUF1702 family protein [Rugamonas sp. A1-17]